MSLKYFQIETTKEESLTTPHTLAPFPHIVKIQVINAIEKHPKLLSPA